MLQKGLLIVVSAPSGTGKGTVLKLLKQGNENVIYSISATTRIPREGEIEGLHYFFKTIDEFKSMIDKGDLIEWVEYCDNYYGTPRKFVDASLKAGYDVILEIEVEGALNIKKKYPESIMVFIIPPSFEELKRRIEGRGTEKDEVIKKRLEKARIEMTHMDKYEYVVVNDKIECAVDDLNSILRAEKLKVCRYTNISDIYET